jgi:hypothetical protein
MDIWPRREMPRPTVGAFMVLSFRLILLSAANDSD